MADDAMTDESSGAHSRLRPASSSTMASSRKV